MNGLVAFSLFFLLQAPPSPSLARAAVKDTEPPRIEIRHAQTVDYDGQARLIRLDGAVHVVRLTMSIKADHVVIHLTDDEKRVQSAVATGHVDLVDGERRGRADRAEFIEASQDIILTGNPKLRNGPNEMAADSIVYNLNARTMRASGRVRGILVPGATF
ncbi:MAG: LptA/OstA family protein [Candidatus Hydrogenedentota bacterium]